MPLPFARAVRIGIVLVLALPGAASAPDMEWNGVTAAALRVHVFPGGSVAFGTSFLCEQEAPTTHHCAGWNFVAWDGVVRQAQGHEFSRGNWTLKVRTPLNEVSVPVLEYPSDPQPFDMGLSYAFDEDTDVVIAVLSTHPETLSLRMENAELPL